MAIYTIASNYKNYSKAHNQTRIIENIDRYFESRRQDFTIFDVPRNLELNITDEVKIQMLPTPNFTKLDGDEFDGEFVEIKRVDEVINNDTNSTINNSKDLNSNPNLKANPSQKLAINSSKNTNIKPKPTNKPKSNKPKLAIIIDDISTFYHAKKIKSLGLNITPSISKVFLSTNTSFICILSTIESALNSPHAFVSIRSLFFVNSFNTSLLKGTNTFCFP